MQVTISTNKGINIQFPSYYEPHKPPKSIPPNPQIHLPPKLLLLKSPQHQKRNRTKRKSQLKSNITPIPRRTNMSPNRPNEPNLRHSHHSAENAKAEG